MAAGLGRSFAASPFAVAVMQPVSRCHPSLIPMAHGITGIAWMGNENNRKRQVSRFLVIRRCHNSGLRGVRGGFQFSNCLRRG